MEDLRNNICIAARVLDEYGFCIKNSTDCKSCELYRKGSMCNAHDIYRWLIDASKHQYQQEIDALNKRIEACTAERLAVTNRMIELESSCSLLEKVIKRMAEDMNALNIDLLEQVVIYDENDKHLSEDQHPVEKYGEILVEIYKDDSARFSDAFVRYYKWLVGEISK